MKIRAYSSPFSDPYQGETHDYTFENILSISYSPDCNIVSNRVSIDTIHVEMLSTNGIEIGDYIVLSGNGLGAWTRFICTNIDETGIDGRSELYLLDKKIMPAKMYDGESYINVINEIFADTEILISSQGFLPASMPNLSGFAGEMTARERLQQVLFVYGLYCVQSFASPTIKAISNEPTDIPIDKTYYKPEVHMEDYVTAVSVTSYSFSSRTPVSGDKTVTDGTNTWVVTETKIRLTNQGLPAAAVENEVDVDGVYLVTSANADSIASMLANYYFNNTYVDADVIDSNKEYNVGDLVGVMLSDESDSKQAVGYIESASFRFGRQAMASIRLGACSLVPTVRLTIQYVSAEESIGSLIIGKRTYNLPAGSTYEIDNPYLTSTIGNYKYVFRPETETVTGTLTEETTVDVNVYFALKLNKQNRKLEVISVDAVENVEHGSGSSAYNVAEID